MTFGEKLKQARKGKKLTQRELADAVGAKHNSISDWEKDKCRPDMDTIELLCGVLEITPTYLVGSQNNNKPNEIVENIISQPDILEMLTQYSLLDDEDKQAIKQIISSLSRKGRD